MGKMNTATSKLDHVSRSSSPGKTIALKSGVSYEQIETNNANNETSVDNDKHANDSLAYSGAKFQTSSPSLTASPSTKVMTSSSSNNPIVTIQSTISSKVSARNVSSTSNLSASQQQAACDTNVQTDPSKIDTLVNDEKKTNNPMKGGQYNDAANGSLPDSMTSNDDHRTPSLENLSKTNLYIRGLSPATTDRDLYNMCNRFGNITSTKAIIDKATGCCKGYGFVQFTASPSAEAAVQELTKCGVQAQMARISPNYSSHGHQYSSQNQHHHQGNSHFNHRNNDNNNHNHHGGHGGHHNASFGNHAHNLSSSSHNNGSNSNNNNNYADPTNLYIANLPSNMTEQELENLLSGYGPVVSTRVLRDERNNPRGVGFARMESRVKCQEIIDKLNGKPFKGSKEPPLLIKFADGGNKKRHHHNSQHHHNNQHQHQQHQKVDENRGWRESSGASGELNNISNFDHQGNLSHNNQLTDLAMMNALNYTRMQPAFPPTMTPGNAYPTPLGPPSNAPQWIHAGGPGQPWNVIHPHQMIQSGSLAPSSQAAAAPFTFGHISQLTSQMQGLQIAHHPGAAVGGYLAPQHQWSAALWPPPPHMQAQQPQPGSMRLEGPIPATPMSPAQQQPPAAPLSRQQVSSSQHQANVQEQSSQQKQPSVAESKLQASSAL